MNQNKKASSSSSSNGPGEDCIANGAISIELPNLDALNDVDGKAQQVTSDVHKIGGLAWQMKVRKVLRPTRLNVFIHCNEQVKDRLWLCKVHFTMKIWAPGEEDKPFYSKSGHFYGFNGHYWIFPVKIYTRYKLEKRPFEIKLEIKLGQVQETSLPTLDTSLVVNMGEGHSETLFVNKHSMAGLSSYFRKLFFENLSDKKEHDGNMFELNETDNFDIRAFKAMIYSAMTLGSCWMVQESNFLEYELAVEIVKQSIKFDMAMLQDCCMQFLIGVKEIDHPNSAMEKLELAEQFNLAQLKEQCLKKISISDIMWSNIVGKCYRNKNKAIFLRLSRATQEELRARLDGKMETSPRSKAAFLELLKVADRYNLVRLKQQCLDEMNVLHYMTIFSREGDYSRLSKATRVQLQAKLGGKAEELRGLMEQLKSGVEANKTKRVLVEQFNKLAESMLGKEQSEEKK